MTSPAIVKYQVSTKAPDGTIVVAAAEGADAGIAYDLFRSAVDDLGLTAALANLGQPGPMAAALQAAQPLTNPAQPWGQPPVQPMQQHAPQVPAAAQAPASAGESCQHGPKTYKSGETNGRAWAFWGCNAQSNDPTKCDKQWVR